MEDFISNDFWITIPYWQYIVLGLIFILFIISIFVQVKLSRNENPYYGFIIPFILSLSSYIVFTNLSLIILFVVIIFSFYTLVYLIARFNGKKRKLEHIKIDIKDL
jgi:hypothetical protein